MIEDRVRRIADRNPPQVFTRIHVDRSDTTVRRLEDIQAIGSANAEATQHRKVGDRRTGRLFH